MIKDSEDNVTAQTFVGHLFCASCANVDVEWRGKAEIATKIHSFSKARATNQVFRSEFLIRQLATTSIENEQMAFSWQLGGRLVNRRFHSKFFCRLYT